MMTCSLPCRHVILMPGHVQCAALESMGYSMVEGLGHEYCAGKYQPM